MTNQIQAGDRVRLKAWRKDECYLTFWPHMQSAVGHETVVLDVDETDGTARVELDGFWWPACALEPVKE